LRISAIRTFQLAKAIRQTFCGRALVPLFNQKCVVGSLRFRDKMPSPCCQSSHSQSGNCSGPEVSFWEAWLLHQPAAVHIVCYWTNNRRTRSWLESKSSV